MQNDMAARLLDENGDLKPFNQWLNDIKPIADHQNRIWFQTEYDTAIKRAHQAAEWKQFEREADVLPNLEWLRTTSITPNAEHAAFWSIPVILPVNDPFWDKHRPGDRWGCKCSLRATDKPATPKNKIPDAGDEDKPSPGLDSNPAKDAQIFSDNHPYNPPSCAACTLPGKRIISKDSQTFTGRLIGFFDAGGKKDCYHCSKPVQLLKKAGMKTENVIKQFQNGGVYKEYNFIDKGKSDYKLVKNIGIEFARTGKSVTATPVIHFKSKQYSQIYGSLIGTKYYRKCPDLLIDGKTYEVEGYIPPFKKGKVSHMLKNGFKQSPRIIINNTKGASDRFIRNNIYRRIKDKNFNYDIEEVWLYEKGKIRLLYKKTGKQ